MKPLVDLIKKSQKIVLTTHRDCDGDGLGSELALFYALKKIGKDVQIVHVDFLPKRYENFLNKDLFTLFRPTLFDGPIDLCLIFDTNDERLIEPLFSEIQAVCKNVVFVDHHPMLKSGPLPTKAFIDTTAASTGEIVYYVIKSLDVPLDTQIAESLYLSIVFDTQLFRYVRRSVVSHQIAIELLPLIPSPEAIHRNLFGGQTPEKISFISKALSKITYYADNKVAIVLIHEKDIEEFGLTPEDTRDVVDKILDIDCVEAAILFREDTKNRYKISFRSKSLLDVLEVSELFGGGGHHHASGAMIEGEFLKIRDQIIDYFKKKLE